MAVNFIISRRKYFGCPVASTTRRPQRHDESPTSMRYAFGEAPPCAADTAPSSEGRIYLSRSDRREKSRNSRRLFFRTGASVFFDAVRESGRRLGQPGSRMGRRHLLSLTNPLQLVPWSLIYRPNESPTTDLPQTKKKEKKASYTAHAVSYMPAITGSRK